MGVVLRARFDGRAIIPDEPINLPEGTVLEVEVRILPPEDSTQFEPLYRMIGLAEQGPVDASVHHDLRPEELKS
jgi:hypothetical protein